MEEIPLKYIEINCVNCYYIHGPRRRIRDTTNVRLIIDLQKLIMQRIPVQRETTFAQFGITNTLSKFIWLGQVVFLFSTGLATLRILHINHCIE